MAKIDCSVTVNFVREYMRMCEFHKPECDSCPLSFKNNSYGKLCRHVVEQYPDTAVEIVQKWSDEHSAKTRLDDVKEKYPNVEMVDGTPMFYPLRLGYCKDCDKCIVRGLIKRCWNEPVDGGATGKAVE